MKAKPKLSTRQTIIVLIDELNCMRTLYLRLRRRVAKLENGDRDSPTVGTYRG